MDFSKKYVRVEYLEFFKNSLLPESFKESNEDVPFTKKLAHIAKLTKIGEVPDWKLNVYEAEHASESDPRVTLSKDIFRVLINYGVERALVVFKSRNSDNFRLSLVTVNIKFGEEGGKKVVKEYSNPKRYSFFMGPESLAKTPYQFLVKKGTPKTFKELLERFSVEAVTDDFYNKFSPIFEKIAESVKNNAKNKVTEEIAKDFTLLFVIRIIFIGFLQKKGWIGNNKSFIQDFWDEYRSSKEGKDQFYDKWLKALIFEALNCPPRALIKYKNPDFSKETKAALEKAPYLNGGLFQEKNDVDDIGLSIKDKDIKEFFDFLFQYNFTIEENTHYDMELELNPEFLGIIFERLVNKADGAVYTPRTEVDFMCRISLVKWLEKNNTTNIDKKDLYELFFMEIGTGDKLDIDQKDGSFSKRQIDDLLNLIGNVTVCDPAVGSGAFPVGMLQVIDEIECKLKKMKKEDVGSLSAFERKKRVIGRSLYGVEVKPWAVWICQLRLWITLFIEAPEEMRLSQDPILPSLDFKIACGDSLVQIIGSKMFPIEGQINIKSPLKVKLTELKKKKIEYFNNKLRNRTEIIHDEILIISAILQEEMSEVEKKIRNLTDGNKVTQGTIEGFGSVKPETKEIFEEEIKKLNIKCAEIKEQLKSVVREHPFIWSIEFPEIFFEKGGFDIAIGNPPYVRQESIEDPTGKIKDKKEYKNRLQEMVRMDFPKAFPAKKKINAQSDLYTYFYIRSLRLLNEKGIHTFICSNSWLDVGYGIWLQGFLLDNARVHFIFDNHAKRSFANADVNTIISVVDAPAKNLDQNSLVKFVAFKKPFEEVIYTEKLLEIENSRTIIKTEDFRAFPKTIIELKEEGWDYSEDDGEDLPENMAAEKKANYGFSIGKYVGQKWGGIYLRSPDIYFKILEKGRGKLVKLGDIAEVKFGIKTGCNEFFYLDETRIKEWNIEREYLKPVIKSPKECNSILITPKEMKNRIFICNKTKSELNGTNALKYIEWGERQKTEEGVLWKDVPSVGGRKYWWWLGERKPARMNFNYLIDEIATAYIGDCFASDNFHEIRTDAKIELFLNSSIFYLFQLNAGRVGFGGGLLKIQTYELQKLFVFETKESNIQYFKIKERTSIYDEYGINPKINIRDQIPKPVSERKELDDIIFDGLKLTKEERNEVYWAVCELVKNRLSKAGSV